MKEHQEPRDSVTVNLKDDHDLRYWTEKWNVTEAVLRKAVQLAGPGVEEVSRLLAQNPKRL